MGLHARAFDVTLPSGALASTSSLALANNYYGISALQKAGYNGSGIRVGIVTFGPFNPSDISEFDQLYNLPPDNINVIQINGGVSSSFASNYTETDADIDVVHDVTPNATIDVYEAPSTMPIYQVFSYIINNGHDNILSISWGQNLISPYDLNMQQTAAQLASSGVPIFAASGDTGGANSNSGLYDPAFVPNVIGVGGVDLQYMSGSYAEVADSHSTGGYNTEFQEPLYQAAINMSSALNSSFTSYRMGPDIAGPYNVVSTQSYLTQGVIVPITTSTGQSLYAVTGTSIAAPYEAGLFADLESAKGPGSLPVNLYSWLYQKYGTNVFDKITSGSNGVYSASPSGSYNMVSGMGTVNVLNVAEALGIQVSTPAPSSPSETSGQDSSSNNSTPSGNLPSQGGSQSPGNSNATSTGTDNQTLGKHQPSQKALPTNASVLFAVAPSDARSGLSYLITVQLVYKGSANPYAMANVPIEVGVAVKNHDSFIPLYGMTTPSVVFTNSTGKAMFTFKPRNPSHRVQIWYLYATYAGYTGLSYSTMKRVLVE